MYLEPIALSDEASCLVITSMVTLAGVAAGRRSDTKKLLRVVS